MKISSKRKSRKGLITAGLLFLFIGAALLTLGIIVIQHNSKADADGYHWSEPYTINSKANAFCLEFWSLNISHGLTIKTLDLIEKNDLVLAQWDIQSDETSKEIFAGLAKTDIAVSYIVGMRTEIPYPSWHFKGPYAPELLITTTAVHGNAPTGPMKPPNSETIWLQKEQGTHPVITFQPLWQSHADDKRLVIMNTDGSADIHATIRLGYKLPVLETLYYYLFSIGILCIFAGLLFLTRRKVPKADVSADTHPKNS